MISIFSSMTCEARRFSHASRMELNPVEIAAYTATTTAAMINMPTTTSGSVNPAGLFLRGQLVARLTFIQTA